MPDTVPVYKPFYTKAWLYLLLAMVVIIAGFVPSFFTRMGSTDAWHHVHGLSATAWLALLVIQPLLYANGRMKLHRTLGRSSFALVPLLVVGGVFMIRTMVRNRDQYPPLEAFRLSFYDTVALIFFVFFFIQAIRHVRTTGLHARYLVATVILLEPPGMVRLLFNLLPGTITGFEMGLHISYALLELVTAILLVDDWRRDKKLSPPYLMLLVLLVFLHAVMPASTHWAWWQSLALWLYA